MPEKSIRHDERGIALAAVLIIGFVIALLVTATLAFAVSSQELSRHDQNWNAALAASEAGIDDYLYRLNRYAAYWQYDQSNPAPDGNQAYSQFVEAPGADNDAEFKYTIDKSVLPSQGILKLTATGRVKGTTRTVEATLRRRNFLDYLYFTDYETTDPALYGGFANWANNNCVRHFYDNPTRHSACSDINFFDADVINGPLHSNDAILIAGGPDFLGETSTSWSKAPPRYRVNSCCTPNPTFAVSGDPRYASPLAMPPTNNSIKAQTDPLQGGTGCLYSGPTRITLKNNGKMDVTSHFTSGGNCAKGNNISLPPNGVIYVQNAPAGSTCPNSNGKNPLGYPINNDITSYGCLSGDVFLSGTLNGQLTIAAQNRIIVTGNVVRNTGQAGNDLLGLIADNYVEIYHPVSSNGTELASLTNVTVEAAILSLQHSFTVQNYNRGSPRGTLSVRGAIAQKFRGPVGTFSGNAVSTGFVKDYVYDNRLKFMSPPFFLDPVESSWHVTTWAEKPPQS